MRRLALLASLVLAGPSPLAGQDYLLRLDAQLQTASYRGVEEDSIPASQVVTGSTGGPQTPSGFAVTCTSGSSECIYFRPGAQIHSGPFVTTADLTAWGFGVRGLSLHANARLGVDLGTANAWPGTEPAVQLLEGYAEYAGQRLDARLGRQAEQSRLGYYGFDGGRISYRLPLTGFNVIGYLGLGLAQGIALPVTSGALNPLDNWQPEERQILAGAALEYEGSFLDVRADYEREVDRPTHNFVSERAALSATLRPIRGWSLVGGADYDLGRAQWGSADLSLRHTEAWIGGSVGVRRYQPYFDLWTIWGVFSPVGYSATNGTIWVTPVHGLTVRAGGERYWYADAGVVTPLVSNTTDGWRWNAGATLLVTRDFTVDGGYQAEFGSGAASRGWDGSASWRPAGPLTLTLSGGQVTRPLEFRYDAASVYWYGVSADARAGERLRFRFGLTRYDEDRSRPDAAAFDWNQMRLQAGISWLFGSNADFLPLPPAIPREGRR